MLAPRNIVVCTILAASCGAGSDLPTSAASGPPPVGVQPAEEHDLGWVGPMVDEALGSRRPELYLQAEQRLERAIEAGPGSAILYCALGDILRDGGTLTGLTSHGEADRERSTERAIQAYHAALDLDPQHVSALRGLAWLQLETGRPERAVSFYEALLELRPDDPEARFGLGRCAYEAGDFELARQRFAALVAQCRERGDLAGLVRAQEYLGRSHLRLGQVELAETLLEESARGLDAVLERGDSYRGCPYHALGELYASTGRFELARANYDKAAEMERFNDEAQLRAALAALASGELDVAIRYMDRAVELSPDPQLQSLREAMLVLGGEGLPPLEQAQLEQDFGVDADRGRMRIALLTKAGLMSFDRGQYSTAQRCVDMARSMVSMGADGSASRLAVIAGFLHLMQQRYPLAKEQFAEAARLDGEDPGVVVGLGHLDIVGHAHSQAEARFRQVQAQVEAGVEADGTAPSLYAWFTHEMLWLGFGWVHINQGQNVLALDDFQRILQHQPDEPLALVGLASALMAEDRLDEAQAALERVLVEHPDHRYAITELGLVHYNRGEDALAEELMKRALELEPARYSCPHEGLGLVYLRQGKIQAAQEHFVHAIEISPDAEFRKYNGLARIYLGEGRLEEAERLLTKSIENYPYDDEARLLLEELQRRRGAR